MIPIFFFLLIIGIIANTIGVLFEKRFLGGHKFFSPIIGLASLILLLSNSFILNLSPYYIIVPIICIIFYNIKELDYKILFKYSLITFISLLITIIPYFLINKNNINITGFIISNDTVIHAIFSRKCEENIKIQEKIYLSNHTCTLGLPSGAYGLVNAFSVVSKIDTAFLIIPVSLLFLSYSTFVILHIFSLLKIDEKLSLFVSSFINSSFFYLAIAYHGFLSQSAYVVFTVLFSILLFDKGIFKNKKIRIVVLAILLSASISVYSFVSMLAILFIMLGYLIFNFRNIQQIITEYFLIIFVSLLFLGMNMVPIVSVISDVINVFFKQSTIVEESSSYGNLLSIIDNRMSSGIWFESDYRLIRTSGLRFDIQLILSSISIFLSSISFYELTKKNHFISKIFLTFLSLYFFIMIFTGSPYSLIKIQSLIFIFVPIFFVLLIVKKLSSIQSLIILAIYIAIINVSNLILLRNISTLSSGVLINLNSLNEIIGSKKTLFYTDNDWALYYVDSQNVDITDLNYRKDIFDIHLGKYELIIKDGNNNFDTKCVRSGSIGSYYYCEI